ncbi:effector-associated domain EAD1-containing protein [Streptomyces mirabilis]|uniref:effector-associated domain EAD1-containing protein n=1 Tax=Streptomyces mirabilis TaxID=68239 RepID=UPI0036A46F27
MTLLLDRRVFTLDDPQAQELLQVLLDVYEDKNRVKWFVKSAGVTSSRIDWDGAMDDVWPEVLEKAAREGGLRALVKVISENPNSTEYQIFKTLLTQEPPAADADPCSALLLGGRLPRAFINRRELRSILRDMLCADGSRVLIVTGDQKTGKSWTWFLLCHVLAGQAIRPYRVDLSTYADTARVADIAAELRDQFGWEMDPADLFAGEDVLARSLVNTVKREMRKTHQEHWLVFDGLAATELTESALRLVEDLASAVARGETGDGLRVVLIAYDGRLPPSIDPYVWRERVHPINVQDLRDFFCAVAASVGGRVGTGRPAPRGGGVGPP